MISFGVNIVMAFDVKTSFPGSSPTEVQDPMRQVLGAILAIVRTAGVTAAVVILMVIGIKYIIASAGDRADIKKYAVKYIIGALILFAASGIIEIAKNIISESFNEG